MRFRGWISEGIDYDDVGIDINELIHKHCKKYLGWISGMTPMIKGMYSGGAGSIGKKSVRKDRIPSGMTELEADYLNDWLQKNGHARRDQSVICTSSEDHSRQFGHPHYIFPIDPVSKYTWINTKDMNITGDLGWKNYTIEAWVSSQVNGWDELSDIDKRTLESLQIPFEDFFTTNNGFSICHRKGYEMWIDCNEYYYVLVDICNWDKNTKTLEILE
jgi:hypothetical protein